ncbi:DNA polymerase [Shewanella phage FishSpeaker]|nr:DNA polymerase [Shewanella phage FishSpeaker]
MSTSDSSNPVIARVCKHAAYNTSSRDKFKDILTAKITEIMADGTRNNLLIAIEDYKQDFYIVKEKHRKFNQHKDYIEANKCDKFRSTRARLPLNISKVLYGFPDRNLDLVMAKNSPYVFGCEQSIPVVFKHKFHVKYPEYQEKERYTVASYDVETNMWSKEEEIIMAATTMKDKVVLVICRSWFGGDDDKTILANLKEAEQKYMADVYKRRGIINPEYLLVDTPCDVVVENVSRWHKWSPDWIGSWNAKFDMEKNEAALFAGGRQPKDVYTDPSVPPEYRKYIFHPGRPHKIKEDGSKTPLEWQERFPTVRTLAGWCWLDTGSLYAIKRTAKGKLDSYALQAVTEREKVDGKLYFQGEETSRFKPGSLEWHKDMQKNFKYQYCMYCIKDNICIEEIDEKTDDMGLSLSMLLKYSEYFNFPSQPNLISDTLSFIALENNYVWGCTPNQKDETFKKELPSLGNWIALLFTEQCALSKGKQVFEGLWDLYSRARGITDDIDVEGAYPSETVALNCANKTTQMEVCKMQGKNEEEQREISINYACSPKANAIGLCNALFGFPLTEDVKEVFEAKLIELGMETELKKLTA